MPNFEEIVKIKQKSFVYLTTLPYLFQYINDFSGQHYFHFGNNTQVWAQADFIKL